MCCIRCDGFLVAEEFIDLRELNGPEEFQGVRCLNCGYIGDAVILANRFQHAAFTRAQFVGNSGMDGTGTWGNTPPKEPSGPG